MLVAGVALTTRVHAQSGPQLPLLGKRAALPNVAVKTWNPSGSLRFIAWDKDTVAVRGRVGRGMQFVLGGGRDGLKVGVEGHWSDGASRPSDLVVYVPRRAMISAKTVSADITGTGVGGWFYTTNGDLRMSGAAQSLEVETLSGNIDLDVAVPWVRARTGTGHLLLRGAPQDADASTVSGTLSIATSAVMRGQFGSVTGDVHYAPPTGPSPRAIIEFANHAGAVELMLPSSTSAALSLSSITGSIENGLPGVRPVTGAQQSMRVSLGRGESQITVRTFKGPIKLRGP